jgi:hypothetical protein
MLKRLLRLRFGGIPDSLAAVIEQGTAEHLERWTDRVIDSPNLESVFSD